MKRKGKLKKILISVTAVVLVLAMGGGIWYYLGHRSGEPVNVYQFSYVGMTEYWGDSQESYGPVTTDKIQTIYLSDTQTVTEIMVAPGDVVSKGDILMTFDTTLSDLALERKRLDVEKLKLQLEDAKDRLAEINSMRPMVIPEPTEPEDPEDVNLGIALTDPYRISDQHAYDGSTQELALICWLNSGTAIDDGVLDALLLAAQEYQKKNAAANSPTAETEEQTTESSSEPTDSTEPSSEPTDTTGPSSETTDPTEPPVIEEVNNFYVIFKVTEGDMSLGQTQVWQGMRVTRDSGTGGYQFKFFDASGMGDHTLAETDTPVEEEPEIDFGSGYTASQIAQMRSEQEKTIKDLQFNIKMAEADYKIMQTEVSDGTVRAEIDGTVVSLLSEEEAKLTQQPLLKLSGGGGFYVEGSVSELDKDNLQIGQEVTINDWNTGMVYTGTISALGDFPSNDGYFSGIGNPNASYYPFTVFVDESADLQAGSYVSIMYSAGVSENGIYLENPFLRTEQGRSYVYIQGEDGLLEKRYVTTGKSLWGSYTEILEGITAEDLIAFPYGKNVKSGAQTVESDLSSLYG